MNELNFCYWLQGFFELKKTIDHREGFSPETVKVIEDHLQLVFKKVTPQYQFPVTTTPYNPPSIIPFDSTFPNTPKLGDGPGIAHMATC